MSKDDEQLKAVMKWTTQGCGCNEQLRVVDVMNSSGLWKQWIAQGYGCHEQLKNKGIVCPKREIVIYKL